MARPCRLGCLYTADAMAALPAFAGTSEPARSNLSPFAIWFSSSIWVRRMLLVVHAYER